MRNCVLPLPRVRSYPLHTLSLKTPLFLREAQNLSFSLTTSMASFTLLSFRPAGIRASVSSGHRKPERSGRKPQSSSWWTPIFGWSSDADYIESGEGSEKTRIGSEMDSETARSRSRFSPGCFTEEKAKQLRMKTMETSTFHDIMYHSAIASRLASDVPNRLNW